MKTLIDTLENHKNTTVYATAANIEGMVPEIGETVTGGGQSMKVEAVEINVDGHIVVVFGSGQKMDGRQLAGLQAQGVIELS